LQIEAAESIEAGLRREREDLARFEGLDLV